MSVRVRGCVSDHNYLEEDFHSKYFHVYSLKVGSARFYVEFTIPPLLILETLLRNHSCLPACLSVCLTV